MSIQGNNFGSNQKIIDFDSAEKIPNLNMKHNDKKNSLLQKNGASSESDYKTDKDKNSNNKNGYTKNNSENQGNKTKSFSESKLSNDLNSGNKKNNKQKDNVVKETKPVNENLFKDDDEEDEINKIVIGLNDKKKKIFIPESSRYFNTLVLGTKATGKTAGVLPLLVEQDLKNKDYGCTIVVSKNEMAYNLYALAKQYKRDVIILKPSINNEIANKFLWRNDYNYDYINENIINYKEAIKKRQIVIIDMEILKHKSDGLKAVAMLLLQLQLDMQETDITQKKPHFLYVDDGQYYLPFLENLFTFSDNYNLGITLFLQSRAQLTKNNKDYSYMIDNNIRNLLILNSLDKQDVDYYKERLYEYKASNLFYNRELTEICYETIDLTNKRKCGIADYKNIFEIDWEALNNKAKTFRNKLLKDKRKELEKEMLLSIKSKYEYSGEENEDEYIEDSEGIGLDLKESQNISNIEVELIKTLPSEDFDDDYEDIGEPVPIDLKILETNEPTECEENDKDLDIQNHLETVKKEQPYNNMTKKEKLKFKEDKIKEIIRIKEKSVKRNVSTKIFNNIISDIDYCDEDFDFSFD